MTFKTVSSFRDALPRNAPNPDVGRALMRAMDEPHPPTGEDLVQTMLDVIANGDESLVDKVNATLQIKRARTPGPALPPWPDDDADGPSLLAWFDLASQTGSPEWLRAKLLPVLRGPSASQVLILVEAAGARPGGAFPWLKDCR